jgi:hypothetical protein
VTFFDPTTLFFASSASRGAVPSCRWPFDLELFAGVLELDSESISSAPDDIPPCNPLFFLEDLLTDDPDPSSPPLDIAIFKALW